LAVQSLHAPPLNEWFHNPQLSQDFRQYPLKYAKISEDRTKTLRIPRLKAAPEKLELSSFWGRAERSSASLKRLAMDCQNV
jgi:hypothetical protein